LGNRSIGLLRWETDLDVLRHYRYRHYTCSARDWCEEFGISAVPSQPSLLADAFNAYKNATGAELDSATGLLKLNAADFAKLKDLDFTIGGRNFTLTPNAQIWPRALNTAIGGTTDNVYLIVADVMHRFFLPGVILIRFLQCRWANRVDKDSILSMDLLSFSVFTPYTATTAVILRNRELVKNGLGLPRCVACQRKFYLIDEIIRQTAFTDAETN
jgi:hypothetical protein